MKSVQWRAYLDMCGCDRFEYNLVKPERADYGGREAYWLHYEGMLPYYSYPAIETDIKGWIQWCVRALKRSGMSSYIGDQNAAK